jgi:hypothetical protein
MHLEWIYGLSVTSLLQPDRCRQADGAGCVAIMSMVPRMIAQRTRSHDCLTSSVDKRYAVSDLLCVTDIGACSAVTLPVLSAVRCHT